MITIAYIIFLVLMVFLEIYAVFYATQANKAEYQLGIILPKSLKHLLTITVLLPLLFSFLITFFIFNSA